MRRAQIPRAIGFWRGPQIRDHPFRHPVAFVDTAWDLDERRLVAHYLGSGKRVTSYLGFSWCRFHCGIDDEEMGDSEFSDGLWLWPGGLPHYVLEHAVRLPEEFLDHVRNEAEHRDREYPFVEDELTTHDFDSWVAWSNENSDPASGFKKLEESERKAVVQRRLTEAPELEAEFGVGTEECSSEGCERPILRGMSRCAWHVAGGDS